MLKVTVTNKSGMETSYNFTGKNAGNSAVHLQPGDEINISGDSVANARLSRECDMLHIHFNAGGASGGGESLLTLTKFFYASEAFISQAPTLVLPDGASFQKSSASLTIVNSDEQDNSSGGGGGGGANGSGGAASSSGQGVGSSNSFSQNSGGGGGGEGGLPEGTCNSRAQEYFSLGPFLIHQYVGPFDLLNSGQLTIERLFAFDLLPPDLDFRRGSSVRKDAVFNRPPLALDDVVTIDENTPNVDIDVRNNDSDPDGDALSITLLNSSISAGFLTFNNGIFTYSPSPAVKSLKDGEVLQQTFVYSLSDGQETDEATVTINILGIDNPPNATDNIYQTDEDTPINGNVMTDDTGDGEDSDADNDPITIVAVNGNAANVGNTVILASGAALIQNADGTFSYDPTANPALNNLSVGDTIIDTYTYTLSDGNSTDTATVTLTINGANEVPSAQDNMYVTDEDNNTSGNILTDDTGSGIDTDDDADNLTVTLVNNSSIANPIVLASNATLTQNPDGSFIYDPTTSATMNALAVGESATDTFTYTVSDGNTGTDTATINIMVNGVNDAPVLDTTPTPTLTGILEEVPNANNPGVTVANLLGTAQSDVDNGAVDGIAITEVQLTADTLLNGILTIGTWQFSLDNGATFSNIPAVTENSALVLAPDAIIRLVPAANFFGTATIQYKAWDQTDNNPSGTSGVDTSNDGGTTPFSTAIEEASITVSNINDSPNLDNNGTPTLTAINEDNINSVGTQVKNIIATSIADRDDRFVLDADDLAKSGLAFTARDNTNGIWQYSLDSGANWINFGLLDNNNATLLDENDFVRFVPNANFNGNANITYRAWDQEDNLPTGTTNVNVATNGGTTAYSFLQETARITVNPINDLPTLATNSGLIMANGGTKTITNAVLQVTDIDNIANDLTFTIVTLPASGTLLLNAVALNVNDTFTQSDINNNLLTFQHVNGSGDQTFTFSVADGQGGTIANTDFAINVNDPPTANNDSFTVGTLADVDLFVLGNDSDPENQTLSVSAITVAPNQGGTVSINGDNTISYQSAAFFVGTETFTYQISDLGGQTDTATVTVTVREETVETTTFGAGNTDGFLIEGSSASANAGFAVSYTLDVNGDGLDEVIVGEPNSGLSGAANLVFGKSSITTVDLSALGVNGKKYTGATPNARVGYSVGSPGDINNDGVGDFTIGAPGVNSNIIGNVFAIHGDSPAATLFGNFAPLESLTLTTAPGTASGASVSLAGDVNADGLTDIIFASPGTSRSAVVFGQSSTGTINTSGAFNGFRITGAPTTVGSGNPNTSVKMAGDFNNDRMDDVIIGDSNSNVAHLIFGKTSTTNVSVAALGAEGITITGESAGDLAGFSVSYAGDVNADGIADLIVGAPGATVNAVANAGKAYVIFGKSSPSDVDLSALGADGFVIEANTTGDIGGGDRVGFAVASAGDVNADGFDDLIVGARTADPNATSGAGTAYIIFGKSTTSTVNLADVESGDLGFVINGTDASDELGVAVSSAGDVNGDGFGDLIVGAHKGNVNGLDSGQAYVVFGGLFSTQVSHLGTAGDDTLTGTTGQNFMVGGTGNDLLDGKGGSDALFGGAGNDILRIADTSFKRIDGGNGTDTLSFETSGIALDLTTDTLEKIRGIEQIDLSGTGANSLTISLEEIFKLSNNSNTLVIDGDTDDSLTIDLTGGGFGAGVDIGTHIRYTGTNAVVEIDKDFVDMTNLFITI